MLMSNYLRASEEDLSEIIEKIKNIMQKLQVQILIDKMEWLFNSLDDDCEKKENLLEMYMEWLKNRGYGTATRDLRSKIRWFKVLLK